MSQPWEIYDALLDGLPDDVVVRTAGQGPRWSRVLNSAGGKPMEQLTPQQARKVLVDAQAGATLPAAEVTRKTITIDGKPLGLVVVKPPGSAGKT